MSFHGHLGTDEPPDGDYVRYIRSLVGDPPEDVEQASRELARRLAARRPAAEPADFGPTALPTAMAQPPSMTVPTPVPASAVRRGPTLRQAFSRVLIVIGVILIGLGLVAPDAISMLPGIILLFGGLAIGRNDSRTARRIPAGRK